MARKYLLGVFDDDHVLLNAVKNIRATGAHIDDVYSPFPIHGIDPVLGIKPTRLHTAGFIFGALGVTFMLLFIIWITTVDYPLIIGGKPFLALPAYIPVAFEVTVLSASVGMVVTYFIRNGLSAIRPKKPLDPRTTDDKFIISFAIDGQSEEEVMNIRNLLEANGATEINEKDLTYAQIA